MSIEEKAAESDGESSFASKTGSTSLDHRVAFIDGEIIQCVVEEGTVGFSWVVQAAVVNPVTSFQVLKRLASSRRYFSAPGR